MGAVNISKTKLYFVSIILNNNNNSIPRSYCGLDKFK